MINSTFRSRTKSLEFTENRGHHTVGSYRIWRKQLPPIRSGRNAWCGQCQIDSEVDEPKIYVTKRLIGDPYPTTFKASLNGELTIKQQIFRQSRLRIHRRAIRSKKRQAIYGSGRRTCSLSDVQFSVLGVLFDKLPAGWHFLSHKHAEDQVRLCGALDGYLFKDACIGVHGRFP